MRLETGEISPVTAALAVGFGLLSFVSPCCLPLLPAYLGLIAGSAGTAPETARRRRLFRNALAFVAGLALLFALLGATATLIGSVLLQEQRLLMQIGGVLIVIFGLQMVGILRLGWLARSYLRVEPARFGGVSGRAPGPGAAFLMGAAFGVGWTPCIGLFLGSLLTLAASQETVGQGTLLLFLYGLGLGIPFVVAGLAADRALSLSRRLRPHLATVERAGGAVLVTMGVLLFTGQLTLINIWAIRTFGLGWAF